jgi:hypothetical protein
MLLWLVFFILAITPTYKLTLRWKTKKLAFVAALIGVAVSIVGTPIASALFGFVYDIDIIESLMSGLTVSLLSLIISPLAAVTGWKKANTVHKRLVSKCPQCSTSVGIKDTQCASCGFDLERGGAR